MSLIHNTPNKLREDLENAIRDAIHTAVVSGTDEPSTVAQLTYQLPKKINGVGLSVAGWNLKCSGVFIHQSPFVTFNSMVKQKRIEIGDLLLVSKVTDGKRVRRKAILYQAKMYNKLPVSPDNKNQHFLYHYWPRFRYTHSKKQLNGKIRKVTGRDLYSAAKYLLINKNKTSPSPIWPPMWWRLKTGKQLVLTVHPTEPLSNHESFLKEVYHLIFSDAGKEFDLLSPTNKNIGWSRVVNDLLEITALRATKLMREASDGKNPERGVLCYGDSFNFIAESVPDAADVMSGKNSIPPNDNNYGEKDEENQDGGVSVIEFVLTKTESRS